MATYNGERHLRDQLHSLADQTYLPFELQVGDDGSTDNTLAILDDFARAAPFPVTVHTNVVSGGYGQNFVDTARRCSGDWIAFCDQDDVWLPNKLQRIAAAIETVAADCHLLFHAVDVVDEHLSPLGRRVPARPRSTTHPLQSHPLFWSHLGFAEVISRRLATALDPDVRAPTPYADDGVYPHDSWYALAGQMLGPTVEMADSLALYRRHGGTTSNASKTKDGSRLAAVMATGAPDYERLERISFEAAAVLDHQAHHVADPIWSDRLRQGRDRFTAVAVAYRRRTLLHSHHALRRRLGAFAALLFYPGYFGQGPSSFGLRAVAKDGAVLAAHLFLGPRTTPCDSGA